MSRETNAEQSAAKRYNPATVATFKGKRFVISAGTSDRLVFWSDAPARRLYCMAQNARLGYIGLEAFDTSPLDREETHEENPETWGERRRAISLARTACGSVFHQNAYEQLDRPDMTGDPFDLSDLAIFALLRDYCEA